MAAEWSSAVSTYTPLEKFKRMILLIRQISSFTSLFLELKILKAILMWHVFEKMWEKSGIWDIFYAVAGPQDQAERSPVRSDHVVYISWPAIRCVIAQFFD